MTEKDNIQDIQSANITEDLDTLLKNFDETSGEGLPSAEKLAEMARKAPEPVANGNKQVEIVSHKVLPKSGEGSPGKGVYLEIKNITSAAIGKLTLQTLMFDAKEYVIDTVEKTVTDFQCDKTRILRIVTSAENADVKSYEVKITNIAVTPVAVATGDERKILPNGDVNVSGMIKNVSGIKTDASIAVTFLDTKKEEPGTVVLPVKDIEPGSVKNFSLLFRPPTGEKVKTYTIDIGETAEMTA
ncbi:MAG TPA: hypothetical protein DCR71_03220 [Dehalococcoidia bacterium]|nr:hypothetical protein [Dehalococcoidia bacterium]